MNVSEVRAGDRFRIGPHFECIPEGAIRKVRMGRHGPYVECREGCHLLDGQCDGDGRLVNVTFVRRKQRR